jgi:hypothetical protein
MAHAVTASLAMALAALLVCGPPPAAAHDTSEAGRLSESQDDLPPCSAGLSNGQDCHIHDRQTFREMRANPPGDTRPHAHDDYQREEEEADRDSGARR